MSKFETSRAILPAYWASALINGDASGMDDAEEALCDRMTAELAAEGWEVIDVVRDDETGESQDPWFSWRVRDYVPDADYSGGDMLEYVIMRTRK